MSTSNKKMQTQAAQLRKTASRPRKKRVARSGTQGGASIGSGAGAGAGG